MYSEEPKEPKVVVYKDHELPKIWVWEVHGIDEKIHYQGKEQNFNDAYEAGKKARSKYCKKINKRGPDDE